MEKYMEEIASELAELDKELVEVDGVQLKPSQCYHLETEPPHMLFNLNCPDMIRDKVRAIVAKHLPAHESSSPE